MEPRIQYAKASDGVYISCGPRDAEDMLKDGGNL